MEKEGSNYEGISHKSDTSVWGFLLWGLRRETQKILNGKYLL